MPLLLLCWFLLFPQPTLAIQRSCKSLIAHLSEGESLRSLLRIASEDAITLTPDQYQEMSAAQVRALARKHLLIDFIGEASHQEVLTLEDFSKEERKLIKQLNDLATTGKFVARAAKDPALVKAMTHLEKLRKFFKNLNAEFDESELQLPTGTLDPTLSGIEVGAWRVLLKSGKTLTAPFTSSQTQSLTAKHTSKALLGLLKQVPDLNQVYAVQLFHTHPSTGAKGERNGLFLGGDGGDIGAAKDQEKRFADAGYSVPVHVYAISRVQKELFVFHGLGNEN